MTGFAPLNALIFAALGAPIFFAPCSLGAKIAPLNFWEHIVEEPNLAAAILAGAGMLAIAWIYRTAMH